MMKTFEEWFNKTLGIASNKEVIKYHAAWLACAKEHEKEIERLKEQIETTNKNKNRNHAHTSYEKDVKDLNDRMENMECCGNCMQYTHNCRVTFSSNSVCAKWEMRE